MTQTAGDAQAVLDALVQSTQERKPAVKVTLTPVGAEKGPIPSRTDAPFPNDYPEQNIVQTVLTLRREIKRLTETADAIEALLHPAVESAVKVFGAELAEDPRAAFEAALEEVAFMERFEAMQAAAQEQTYGKPVVAIVAPESTSAWTCPTHGVGEDRLSRKGRPFRACPTCAEFERT